MWAGGRRLSGVGVGLYSTFSQKVLLRRPLWRGKKGLNLEAQQTVNALRLARDDPKKLQQVFNAKVCRMIKVDQLAVLNELQVENEVDIAFKVYEQTRREPWYKPSIPLHRDMLKAFARNGRVEDVFKLLESIKDEKVEPEMVMFTEIIDIFIRDSLFEEAMQVFTLMKESDCPPNSQTYRTLMNSLNKNSQFDLSAVLYKEFKEYVEKRYGKNSEAPSFGPLPRWRKRSYELHRKPHSRA